MEFQELDIIKGYHAHIYFDESTILTARLLCERSQQRFNHIDVGRMHRKPIGPHPCWSCQLAFKRDRFADIFSWLTLNRNGLTILIHPLTGNDLKDHTDYAAWMGSPAILNLNALQ